MKKFDVIKRILVNGEVQAKQGEVLELDPEQRLTKLWLKNGNIRPEKAKVQAAKPDKE